MAYCQTFLSLPHFRSNLTVYRGTSPRSTTLLRDCTFALEGGDPTPVRLGSPHVEQRACTALGTVATMLLSGSMVGGAGQNLCFTAQSSRPKVIASGSSYSVPSSGMERAALTDIYGSSVMLMAWGLFQSFALFTRSHRQSDYRICAIIPGYCTIGYCKWAAMRSNSGVARSGEIVL